MRLLIAEDEVDLAEALTVFFEKITSPSTPCTTASTPMEYASSGAYDAVILDDDAQDGRYSSARKARQEGGKRPS